MFELSGLNTLKVDIINNTGLHKYASFEEKIEIYNEMFESNLNSITEEVLNTFDSPELVYAGLCAMKDYTLGIKSGYLVSFDSTASGIQIMSALTGDINGMINTNLIFDPEEDNIKDVYLKVFGEMGNEWNDSHTDKIDSMGITRKSIKAAVMVSMYGGTITAKQHINDNDDLFKVMINTCAKEINGAYTLKEVLLKCIDKDALEYNWVTPDGFHVFTPIMTTYRETRSTPVGNIDIKYKDIGTSKYYKGNAANFIHSIDATIMREVITRCNYNKTSIDNYYNGVTRRLSDKDTIKVIALLNLFNNTKFLTARILKYVDASQLENLVESVIDPKLQRVFITQLHTLITTVNKYSPFEVICVHDCFKCLPNDMNIVRYWYKEVIAQLMESDSLQYMISHLPNGTELYNKYLATSKSVMVQLASLVRESKYSIC